jgi:glycosyltransferase involved in cell wall biosynthesis
MTNDATPEFHISVVMPVATQRGGAELTLLHAVRHGHPRVQWTVAFLEHGPMVNALRELGARAVVVPAGRVRQFWRFGAALRRLAEIMRSSQPDVIVSWMAKAHLYAGPVARALGVPSVWFQHGLPSREDPLDRLATLIPARAVFAPSQTVAAAQRALRPRRHVDVIYPGVEMDDLASTGAHGRSQVLSSIGVPSGASVVGLVARLQRWKGVHVLLEALPRVLALHPEVHVVVVGGDHMLEPGYRDELVVLARRLGITHRVHLVGYQADPWSWMRAFDVVVHASDNEPLGLVVLEAMALGKPLVAGGAGGPTEVVRDGTDGFLVDFGDHAELAERINRYLGDPALAEQTGQAAATRAQEFSAARFANNIVTALRSYGEGASDQLGHRAHAAPSRANLRV